MNLSNPFSEPLFFYGKKREKDLSWLEGELRNQAYAYVWGEHGAGKTTFVTYFFVRRLVESNLNFVPVILHYEFQDDGKVVTVDYERRGESLVAKVHGGPKPKAESDIVQDVAEAIIVQLTEAQHKEAIEMMKTVQVEDKKWQRGYYSLVEKFDKLIELVDLKIVVVLDDFHNLWVNQDTLELVWKLCHYASTRLPRQIVFPLFIAGRRPDELDESIKAKFDETYGICRFDRTEPPRHMFLGPMGKETMTRFMVLDSHHEYMIEGSRELTDHQSSLELMIDHTEFVICQTCLFPRFVSAVCQELFDEISNVSNAQKSSEPATQAAGECSIGLVLKDGGCIHDKPCYDSENLRSLYHKISKEVHARLRPSLRIVWKRYTQDETTRGSEQRVLKAIADGRLPTDTEDLEALQMSKLVVKDEKGGLRIPKLLQDHISFIPEPKSTREVEIMTIEEEARKMEVFLEQLHKEVVAQPEFKRAYPQSSKLQHDISKVISALKTNRESLEEARTNTIMHPDIDEYKQDVKKCKLGLQGAINEGQMLWTHFRDIALGETQDLVTKAEQAKPEKVQLEKITEGLQQFEKFLTASADVMGAAIRWSIIIGTGLITAVTLLKAVL